MSPSLNLKIAMRIRGNLIDERKEINCYPAANIGEVLSPYDIDMEVISLFLFFSKSVCTISPIQHQPIFETILQLIFRIPVMLSSTSKY